MTSQAGELGMDPERAEVAVVDPQRLNQLVGVGQGVDVGPAEPVDPAGGHRVGGLGGDAIQVAAEDGPRVSRIDGLEDVGDVEGVDRDGGAVQRSPDGDRPSRTQLGPVQAAGQGGAGPSASDQGGQLGAGGDPELGVGLVQVVGDGPGGQEQLGGAFG